MSFINIPFSIIDKRWFSDEMAVRAWIFLAARGVFSKSNPTVSVKNKIFELQPGETLCTRSYLSKSLNIKDSNAKGVTDKLWRSKSIYKQIELLDKGFRNKITRIKVEGIPVPNDPNEAFLKVAMADDISIMWTVKHLAQLYIYLMLSANKFDKITIAGGQILEVKRGELVISYTKIREDLKISEYYLKKTIHFLEGLGLLEKSRCGNDGLFVKMKKYPAAPPKKEKIEEMPVGKTATEVPSKVNANTEIAAATLPIQHSVENPIQKGLPAADWEGWIKNSATKAIVWYAQRRGWKDVDRINNIISDVGDSGLDMTGLKDWLERLWKEYGNNVVDLKDKPVFVDGSYIRKYYAFYLSQIAQADQTHLSTNPSNSGHQNQQPEGFGSDEEIKYAQDEFEKMTDWIKNRGEMGVEYVKNWMSNRHCCVSGFDLESRTLYIDIFEEVKEKWDEDKQHLMPVFRHFFGNNIRLVFKILEHSI